MPCSPSIVVSKDQFPFLPCGSGSSVLSLCGAGGYANGDIGGGTQYVGHFVHRQGRQ